MVASVDRLSWNAAYVIDPRLADNWRRLPPVGPKVENVIARVDEASHRTG
jgi:hypothetical protein